MGFHVRMALIIVVVGFAMVLGWKFLVPLVTAKHQVSTSDAKDIKGTITVAVDNWIGYFPLASQEMKKRIRKSGYLLEVVNDNADYQERMAKLKKGSYQFAVATVDSDIRNGTREDYPATIVAVLDESKGGDAVLAWQGKVQSLDDLKKLSDFKVAYTPDSPSEYLLKGIGVHFDVPAFIDNKGNWRVPTAGSEEALKKLLDKDVDIAVLWEPDVSRALERGKGEIVKLLGTEDTHRFIVDILLVGRKFSEDNPEVVKLLLANYFRTLKYYRDNPEQLKQDIIDETHLSGKQVETMLEGVQWVNLADNNQQWFGVSSFGSIPEEGLIDTIEATVRVLIDSGEFNGSPLPGKDPYRLTNSRFIAELHAEGIEAGQFGANNGSPLAAGGEESLERTFTPLDEEGWKRLREVGTLKVHPIVFQSGRAELGYDAKQELDRAVEALKHYPNFRVIVKGHTGTVGNHDANRKLSQVRADAVAQYFKVTYGINENRVRSVGYGSAQPLPQQPGESLRAYNYRLPRVELYLASEVY